MKKKILTALILSAMMTASLASCGDVKDNDSKADTSSTAASTDTDVTGEEYTTAEEDKDAEPTAEEDSSKADDDSSKSDDSSAPDDTEPEMTLHEFNLASIAAYTFDGGYTFTELNDMGLANVYEEGKAYAIVPLEGGAAAGSVYYGVFNSTDGGENWLPCENYREPNGRNTHIALDDGAILLLCSGSARQESYPVVSYLYFDGIGVKAVELTDVLADLKMSDGTLLKDVESYSYTAAYNKGYDIHLTITDNYSGEDLYDGQFDFTEAIQTALSAQ
ncbi:hypothetical protein [Ruminococcus albus]|uniref:Uncharacterized protein n=1 Tax=Ruminococcus albus TaxID=1264 RepID=A0A1H7KCB5_RUMAL|nr:hypothetical protein [Ruminococcus albus]SEK84478.1 hypothetical protein SAMN05216469_106164 [Ruminococcus albus]